MSKRHPSPPIRLPWVWLVSDARNDAVLETVLARLPRGSGLIFRHYHLPSAQRRARFTSLLRFARRRGHLIFLAADADTARAWRADGAYGPARLLNRGPALPRLVTAHSLREIGRASRARAIVLSPVFATRSHPDGRVLGPLRFRLLARRAREPIIALGGMTPKRGADLGWPWAAIDGLSPAANRRIPKDS